MTDRVQLISALEQAISSIKEAIALDQRIGHNKYKNVSMCYSLGNLEAILDGQRALQEHNAQQIQS